MLSRRNLLTAMCAGSALGTLRAAAEPLTPEIVKRYRVWDEHVHMHRLPGNTPEERVEVLIRAADRFGIERLCMSQGFCQWFHPTPEQLVEENNRVLRAIKRFPDRTFGWVYVSPAYPELSVREIDRCLRDGPMVAIGEIEADKLCNVPEMDPIVERAISLGVPIMQHTFILHENPEPGQATPEHLVELARRHPKATFICAHTGGDWEKGIRMIRDTPNILAGTAGFDPTAGVVEMAVRELGAERVVYGSDVGGRSFASQLSKTIGADIPESAKKLVLGGNLRRLLTPILRAKGIKV